MSQRSEQGSGLSRDEEIELAWRLHEGGPVHDITALAGAQNWRCCWCRRQMHLRPALPRGLRATIEHIIPRSMNGPDVLGNVAAACMECNCSRPSDINEMRHLAALFEVSVDGLYEMLR